MSLPPPDSEIARWFAEEVRPHESRLRAWLRNRFPSLTDIDDLVQESYARLIRARQSGKIDNTKGYLYSTARNAALDVFRHRQVIPIEPLTEKMASVVYTEEVSAPEAASLNQELELLAEAMRELPDRCRQILMLRRIYGLTHREIAERLGIAEHTVEKQVGIGLKRCVEFLRRRGVQRRPGYE